MSSDEDSVSSFIEELEVFFHNKVDDDEWERVERLFTDFITYTKKCEQVIPLNFLSRAELDEPRLYDDLSEYLSQYIDEVTFFEITLDIVLKGLYCLEKCNTAIISNKEDELLKAMTSQN